MNLDHPIFDPESWQHYLVVGQEYEDVAVITMARLVLNLIECANTEDRTGMQKVIAEFETNYPLFERRIRQMKTPEAEQDTSKLLSQLKMLVWTLKQVLEGADG